MSPSSRLGACCLLALTVSGIACVAREALARPGAVVRPTLVVIVIIDQLPAGKLEQIGDRFTGGLHRLLDEGRRFPGCSHEHASTETGPGHATLLSGLFPSNSGIIANDWYDRTAHRDVYCAGDQRTDAIRNFDGSAPVSAGQLKGEGLADLIRRANPASKIYTVAGKDRSAVLTAGRHPDGLFWYSLKTGGFTSSPAIVPELPAWGADFWGADPTAGGFFVKNVPAEWSYPIRSGWGPDDVSGESAAYSRVAPHPLTRIDPASTRPDDRAATVARRVFTSPWVDWMTLQLAGRIVEHAGLGGDDAVDLLVVGLSGVDAVGHAYGPDSQEYLDALLRIDGWLGAFMRASSRRGSVLFALSADHGVLPLPELLAGSRRVDDTQWRERLDKAIAARLGKPGEGPFIESMRGSDVYLDRRTLARLGLPVDAAVEAARAELAGWSEVAQVYRGADLAAGPPHDPLTDLYRNSYDPDRSGDLIIQPCEKCLFTSRQYGTSHGTPYAYDRDVPLILLGPGIRPGVDAGSCRTVDLAPTIAGLLGLAFEPPRDGRMLLGPGSVDSAASGK